jgi:hypothetical protein
MDCFSNQEFWQKTYRQACKNLQLKACVQAQIACCSAGFDGMLGAFGVGTALFWQFSFLSEIVLKIHWGEK